MTDSPDNNDHHGEDAVYGVAALSLLEAIILILVENETISDDELDDAYAAAIDAHRNQRADHSPTQNRIAADILHRLRVSGNSVRLDG